MDRRTKILAGAFGALIAYVVLANVVYPRWIEPLLTIDDIIAVREAELAALEEQAAQIEWAKREFVAYAGRAGSFDIRKVENDLRDRLNTLIETHRLQEASVVPSRPSADRKSGLERMALTINGVGTMRSVVLFLRDVAELPHLVSVVDATFYPASTSRRSKRRGPDEELVNFRVPIQVLVPPQPKILGRRLEPEELEQPDAVVRHEERDYSAIWDRTPFTKYVELPPLEVAARQMTLVVEKDQRNIYLEASVKGGDGEYTYQWEPEDGLSGTNSAKARMDTADTGQRSYVCTVTDGQGTQAKCHFNVTVNEKPEDIVAQKDPVLPTPPRPQGPQRWPEEADLQFTSAWISKYGTQRKAEMAVDNTKTHQRSYYAAGDEFNGGELVFVHQTGALVRRESEYIVVPIGAHLVNELSVEDAVEFPRLQEAARYHAGALKALKNEEGPEAPAADAAQDAEGELLPPADGEEQVGPPDIMGPGAVTGSAPTGAIPPATREPTPTGQAGPATGTRPGPAPNGRPGTINPATNPQAARPAQTAPQQARTTGGNPQSKDADKNPDPKDGGKENAGDKADQKPQTGDKPESGDQPKGKNKPQSEPEPRENGKEQTKQDKGAASEPKREAKKP